MISNKYKLLIYELGDIRVKTDVNLTDQISSGLGGVARAFYIATSEKELIKAIDVCKELSIDFLLVGTGSKIAISPGGFEGLVIKNRNDNVRIFGIKGKVSKLGLGVEEASLEVGSGRSINSLIEYISGQGLKGLEQMAIMEGSVGGNFYFSKALQQLAKQVRVYTKNGSTKMKLASEVDKSDIILSVVLRLKAK